MAVGDANLYFSRDTKVYIAQGAFIWEIPVLNGFSFSQGTNNSEITLAEMADSTGASRRGRAMFNDSLAPAEWSFDTYVRPTLISTSHAAVEEVLWANFVANATPTAGTPIVWTPAAVTGPPAFKAPITRNTTVSMDVGFDYSNRTALGKFDIYFVLGASKAATANYAASEVTTIYKVADASINEVSIGFDIDGIATLSWSGMGTTLREVAAFDALTVPAIAAGVAATNNFIRNRLTQLTATSAVSGGSKNYNLTLTGGTITLTNNLSYLTPEVLGRVNTPLGHVTGTRTIGGSFTCYLDEKTNGSIDLFEDLSLATSKITNQFALDFFIGGKAAGDLPVAPGLQFKIPNAHLSIPSFDTGDVISVSVDFAALPSTISSADEVTAIRYVGI